MVLLKFLVDILAKTNEVEHGEDSWSSFKSAESTTPTSNKSTSNVITDTECTNIAPTEETKPEDKLVKNKTKFEIETLKNLTRTSLRFSLLF